MNKHNSNRSSTFIWPIGIVFTSLFIITIVSILSYIWLTLQREDNVNLLHTSIIAAFMFVISVFIFSAFTLTFRHGFYITINKLRDMISGNREILRGPIEITSTNEIGQLQYEFNQIQAAINTSNLALEQELNIAYHIQRDLLPAESLQWNHILIEARCNQTHEVGGDLYDVVELDDGRLAILIGDVSGKGMAAALLMSSVISLFRREVREGATAANLLSRLNQTLCQIVNSEMMITTGLAIIDRNGSSIQYASAGHMSPLILRVDGDMEEIASSSLPLGIDEEYVYVDLHIDFPEGNHFIMYTDGIIEIGNDYLHGHGFKRLEESIYELSFAGDINEWVNSYMDTLEQRYIGAGDIDDRTLVIVTNRGR
jgi:sigma-B regulation protein RsbU (phosphoserine phosphatase)